MSGTALKKDSRSVQGGRLKQSVMALLDDTQQALEQREQLGEADVVHRIRVAMKRLRAFLRLVRPRLPEQHYLKLDQRCRELARGLAEERDAEVAQATLCQLIDTRSAGDSGERLLAVLRMSRGRQSLPAQRFWEQQARTLAWLQQACDALPLDNISSRQLKKALRKTYRQGRRGWRQARKNADAQQLHKWRKAVKRAFYQNLLLQNTENRHIRRLKQLSDYLGDLHDLDMLEQRLLEQRHRYWLDDISSCQRGLEARRSRLYRKALAKGCKIYGKKRLKKQIRRVVKSQGQ